MLNILKNMMQIISYPIIHCQTLFSLQILGQKELSGTIYCLELWKGVDWNFYARISPQSSGLLPTFKTKNIIMCNTFMDSTFILTTNINVYRKHSTSLLYFKKVWKPYNILWERLFTMEALFIKRWFVLPKELCRYNPNIITTNMGELTYSWTKSIRPHIQMQS